MNWEVISEATESRGALYFSERAETAVAALWSRVNSHMTPREFQEALIENLVAGDLPAKVWQDMEKYTLRPPAGIR